MLNSQHFSKLVGGKGIVHCNTIPEDKRWCVVAPVRRYSSSVSKWEHQIWGFSALVSCSTWQMSSRPRRRYFLLRPHAQSPGKCGKVVAYSQMTCLKYENHCSVFLIYFSIYEPNKFWYLSWWAVFLLHNIFHHSTFYNTIRLTLYFIHVVLWNYS